ncbi:MAG TPA: cytochrome P450 [Gaiellales bacterium]|nr:cytochrome P450 [Gaiellales bacterium]
MSSTLTLDDVYLDNDAFAERVPHETFKLLRDEAPVHWYDWEHGRGFWCITRYDDVVAVMKDWRTFSSETGATALEDLDPDQIEARKSMLDTDPPKHSSLRAIVNKGFTPRAVAAYEDLLRTLTRQILDESLPKGEFDFVEEVAKQLPIQVLCRILGVPLEDDEQLIEWGDKMIGNTDPDLGGLHPASPESAKYRLYPFRSPFAMEVFNYGHRIAAERRKDPRDDLVSKLVMWEDEDGNRLTEREFDTMFLLLVVAGNETTRQSIAHGMQVLMENPQVIDRLREDPELMTTATEEIMRWASPVIHFRRTATSDVEMHGAQIRQGDKVVVWLISGNYDERQFPDPLTFDVTRKPNNHITFGRGGPHFCLGAHLAKLETRIMFEELLPRVKTVEPTGPARRMHSNFTNAYKSMPVRVETA